MEQSEPLKYPTGDFLRNRSVNKWQQLNRFVTKVWGDTHTLVKVVVPIVLFTSIVLAFVSFRHSKILETGGTCSSANDCDLRANFECKDPHCECIQPKSGKAVFDASYVIKGWFSTTIGACVIQPGGTCSPEFPCAPKSICTSNGNCECVDDLQFHKDVQSCGPVRRHGEKCDSSLSCRQGLICFNGDCSCDLSKTAYDPNFNICVGIVGQDCGSTQNTCVPTATCTEGKCRCGEQFQGSNNSQSCILLVKRGGTCSESLKCGLDSFSGLQLKCLNQTCSCDPETLVLEHDHCMPKAGQLCVEGDCSSDSVCDMPARLKSKTSTTKFYCKCTEGKEPHAKTGLCVSKYQGPCRTDSECGHSMACKDFKCHCQFSYQLFDASKNRCASKVSRKCGTHEDCASSAVCNFAERCSCLPEFEETSEGRCTSLHKQGCKHDQDCNHESLLKCIEEVSLTNGIE